MENPLVLTFDVGTQSTRALLVDKSGKIVDMRQIKYDEPYFSQNPGWAEQHPDFHFNMLCSAAKQLMDCTPEETKKRIIAATTTVIRDTVLCLDKELKPLRNMIMWLDKREADYHGQFGTFKELEFKLVGMDEATKVLYKASVVNWIMQNEPDIWAKTAKCILLPTYLNYKLTGRLADSAANMIAHFPFDYKNRCWMGKNGMTRCVSDIPQEMLCELVNSGDVLGIISDTICGETGIPKGLQLIATGSDKGCETLGLSVFNDNQAAVSFGTTATIQMATKKYFEPQQFMPSYPAIPNDMYNPEIQIYRGFWLLSWFVKEFAADERAEAEKLGCVPEKVLDDKLAEIPVGSEGLVLQPFWTAGVKNPFAMGSVIGFADYHTHMHLYRAIIEGIGIELYHSMKLMEKRGKRTIDEIFIGGGGAKSDPVCQITADIFGIPVKRSQTHEACGIGSSMVAFVAKGVFDDYPAAIEAMVHVKDVFTPNAENHEKYMQIYTSVYRKILGKLQPLYKKLKRIKEGNVDK